jgi:hypothetical protein
MLYHQVAYQMWNSFVIIVVIEAIFGQSLFDELFHQDVFHYQTMIPWRKVNKEIKPSRYFQ